jgi:hypothetical protein
MLYSIFDQSIIGFAKPRSKLNADDSAIRAIVAYATDDTTVKLIPRMRQRKIGLTKEALASLKELEDVCQLPKAKKLWTKQDGWIAERKDKIADEIAEAITQFQNHVRRDHKDTPLLREQTSLLANLAFEQQIHICELNDRYLRLSEEKKRLVQGDDKNIHNGVDTIINTMKTLQDALNQRHTTVSEILEPIDKSKIMSTITKLKTALSEISTRNAQLVMRNDLLQFQLSFMPPQIWNTIGKAKSDKSTYYRDQRTNPHYLLPEKTTEFYFERADPNDPRVSKMQRMTAVTSVTDLLLEVDATMKYVKENSDVTDNYDHEDGKIAEDAIDNTNVAPDITYVVPDPERHGPQLLDRVIQSIASDDNVSIRSHNTIVHVGHKVHPSKSQQMIAPTTELPQSSSATQVPSTFGDRPMQSKKVHKTSAYFTTADGDQSRTMIGDNPFSPIGRTHVAYDVTSEAIAEDDDGPTYGSKWTVKGKGKWTVKGKGKGKFSGKGKEGKAKRTPVRDPNYVVVPPFGTAVRPNAIRMYTIQSFYEVDNPYCVIKAAHTHRANYVTWTDRHVT